MPQLLHLPANFHTTNYKPAHTSAELIPFKHNWESVVAWGGMGWGEERGGDEKHLVSLGCLRVIDLCFRQNTTLKQI